MNKIGILGPWGSGNLGDAAIQEAAIFNIKKILPNSVIYGFSPAPDDTKKRHDIEVYDTSNSWIEFQINYPIMFNKFAALKVMVKSINAVIKVVELVLNVFGQLISLFKAVKILRKIDILIISGGGQLDETWGGVWSHPFTLFKWSLAAKLSKIRLVFLSVGVDTLASRTSKYLIKKALDFSDFKSFRDKKSQEIVSNLKVKGLTSICPDLAYSYPVKKIINNSETEHKIRLVGISPISRAAWRNESEDIYEKYISDLISITKQLMKNNINVLYFPTQEKMDVPVIHNIESSLGKLAYSTKIRFLYTNDFYEIDFLLKEIAGADLIIASRLHAVLLSTLLCKPVIAISGQKKLINLMQDLGLQDYRLYPKNLKNKKLEESFFKLKENNLQVIKVLQKKTQNYSDLLHKQYIQLLSLVKD